MGDNPMSLPVTKRWIIKNHDGDYLVGFFANGASRWRMFSEPLAGLEAIVYSTEDLGRVAIPALAKAEVDVFIIERHS